MPFTPKKQPTLTQKICVIWLDVVISKVQSRTYIIISKKERGEIKYLHLTAKEKDTW